MRRPVARYGAVAGFAGPHVEGRVAAVAFAAVAFAVDAPGAESAAGFSPGVTGG